MAVDLQASGGPTQGQLVALTDATNYIWTVSTTFGLETVPLCTADPANAGDTVYIVGINILMVVAVPEAILASQYVDIGCRESPNVTSIVRNSWL